MNTITTDRITIEQAEFDIFLRKYHSKKKLNPKGGQRLGQAFYHYFSLHKMADQNFLMNIYEKDGEEALNTIKAICTFS